MSERYQVYCVYIPDDCGTLVAESTRNKARTHWPSRYDYVDTRTRIVKGEFRDKPGELPIGDPLWKQYFTEVDDGE